MAKYEVFQATHTSFGLGPHPSWPEAYRLVAEVEAEDPEEVFGLTNGDPEHPQVRWVVPDWRSTSVGDVLVGPDGQARRCERFEWSEIPPEGAK